MSLTVPTAGSIAGRSASIRVEAPETGGILAQFGNALAAKAGEWKEEQVQRQTRQTALDLTRDLGVARQEIEANVTDPAEIGPAWDARRAQIEAQYITDDTDPAVAENLRLTMQELGDRHSLALGNRVIGLTQSQRAADWMTTRSRITAEAVNADPETFGAYLELGEATIGDLEARGALTPEQAAAERIALTQEVYGQRAQAMIDRDPAAFLEEAQSGEWNVLGDNLGGMQKAATSAVAEAEAKAAKDAETAAQERSDAIGTRLKEMRGLFHDQRLVVDEAELNNSEVQAHPEYAATRAAFDLRNETPGIRTMTVAQLDKLIAAEEGKPIVKPYEAERLKVLRTWRDEASVKQATDMVSWAQDAGLKVPELPAFDPADPQGFVTGLSQRLSFDRAARQQGYTTGQAVFSTEELKSFKASVDPKADPETRLGMARSFAALGEADARRLAAIVGADPVFLRATELLSGPARADALAADMLQGQARIEAKTVALPSPRDQMRVFDEVTGGALSGNAAQSAQMMAAASALYAAEATGLDPEEDPDAAVTLYEKAVQRAFGAVPDVDGNMTIGGVQEFNGGKVVLPIGVSAAGLQEAWDNIERQIGGQVNMARKDIYGDTNDPVFAQRFGGPDAKEWTLDPAATDQSRLRAFAGASIRAGALPDLGADPADMLSTVRLRPVPTRDGRPSDVFEMVYTLNGREVPVRTKGDPAGTAFRFRLPDLIRGAQQ